MPSMKHNHPIGISGNGSCKTPSLSIDEPINRKAATDKKPAHRNKAHTLLEIILFKLIGPPDFAIK